MSDITEFIRQIDMTISHFERVAKSASEAAKEHKHTTFGAYHEGMYWTAKEAVDWLKQAKKNCLNT